jgi:hypothetical protein
MCESAFRVSFSAERSVVNAHVPSGDTTDESEDSFCEQREELVEQRCRHCGKILLGDFSV